MPPYPYHLLIASVRDHQQELYAAERARANRACAEVETAGRRSLPLRLLSRVLGPR